MNIDLHIVTLPLKDYNELLKTRERNYKQILIDCFGGNMIIEEEESRSIKITIGGRPFLGRLPQGTNLTKNSMWREMHDMLLKMTFEK